MARLYFDDEKIYNSYYKMLKSVLEEYAEVELMEHGIKLYSPDEVNNSATQFPCVTFEVFGQETNQRATDFLNIEYWSSFSVEINTYTTNLNRYSDGLRLANTIIRAFQNRGELGEYYTRGLVVRQKSRTPYPNEDICRFTIRLSGICDNENKIIQPR